MTIFNIILMYSYGTSRYLHGIYRIIFSFDAIVDAFNKIGAERSMPAVDDPTHGRFETHAPLEDSRYITIRVNEKSTRVFG